MRQQVQGEDKIQFAVKCAALGKDHLSGFTHVFLVPDQGYSDILKLHDRLYTGLLAPELRLDLPFIPHLTIASSVDAHICKELAQGINSRDISIHGVIGNLDITLLKDDGVETIGLIELQ